MGGPKANSKMVLIDRDGVVNVDSDAYIKSPEEWIPIETSVEAIRRLTEAGYDVVIVSNQSGIGRGLFSEATLEAIHERMTATIGAAGGRLAGIYYCPHAPADNCDCRKPRAGLLRRIERDFKTSLQGVTMIGDKLSDCLAAEAVGAQPMLVGSARIGGMVPPPDDAPYRKFEDLARAVDALLAA